MIGGLLPDEQTANPMGMQNETSLLPQGGFGGLLGNNFTDPQTFGVLGGAAAMLERAGPQVGKPVSTGQVIGAGLTGFLDQFNARDRAEKLAKTSKKGFISRGPFVRKGTAEYIGEGVFNPETGQMMLSQPDGTLIPMPADAEPSVKSTFSKDILNARGMRTLFADVDEHEISLSKLTNYFNSQEGRQFGFKGVADRFVAGIKSMLGSDDPRLKLTNEQLSQKLSESQLQGLLGASRLDVVGGGVMTEQDALRVLAALGGDVNAMQNPQVVEARIREIYGTRYKRYDTDLGILNDQLAKNLEPPRTQIPNFFATPSGTLSSSAGDVGFEIVE